MQFLRSGILARQEAISSLSMEGTQSTLDAVLGLDSDSEADAHFEAVHPFLDGNGRVGRLLTPLMLAAEGYEPVYISPWIEAIKALYYEGLKAAQQQLDPAALTGAFAKAIVDTDKELASSEAALGKLNDIWRSAVKLRKNSSADRLLAILLWLPVLSVKTASDTLSVTPKAAGDGIKALCTAGILKELTGWWRNRIFEAPDVMRIITRPFGAVPILPHEDCDSAASEDRTVG